MQSTGLVLDLASAQATFTRVPGKPSIGLQLVHGHLGLRLFPMPQVLSAPCSHQDVTVHDELPEVFAHEGVTVHDELPEVSAPEGVTVHDELPEVFAPEGVTVQDELSEAFALAVKQQPIMQPANITTEFRLASQALLQFQVPKSVSRSHLDQGHQAVRSLTFGAYTQRGVGITVATRKQREIVQHILTLARSRPPNMRMPFLAATLTAHVSSPHIDCNYGWSQTMAMGELSPGAGVLVVAGKSFANLYQWVQFDAQVEHYVTPLQPTDRRLALTLYVPRHPGKLTEGMLTELAEIGFPVEAWRATKVWKPEQPLLPPRRTEAHPHATHNTEYYNMDDEFMPCLPCVHDDASCASSAAALPSDQKPSTQTRHAFRRNSALEQLAAAAVLGSGLHAEPGQATMATHHQEEPLQPSQPIPREHRAQHNLGRISSIACRPVDDCSHPKEQWQRYGNQHGSFLKCRQCGLRWKHVDGSWLVVPVGAAAKGAGKAKTRASLHSQPSSASATSRPQVAQTATTDDDIYLVPEMISIHSDEDVQMITSRPAR
eukprot:6460285-Amphidinium_carterae.1